MRSWPSSRQAEVGQHRFALLVEQHIRRLYVAVNHALPVRVGQRFRQEPDELCRLSLFQTLPLARLHGVGQRAAGDIRTGDVVMVAILTRIMHAHNVCVPQVRRRPRLAQTEPATLLTGEDVRPNHLQRHFTVEVRVVCLVDDAERAGTELLANLEAGNLCGLIVGRDEERGGFRRVRGRGVVVGLGWRHRLLRGRRLRRGGLIGIDGCREWLATVRTLCQGAIRGNRLAAGRMRAQDRRVGHGATPRTGCTVEL